jgi:bifunctional non-homologous end joining protein LigD
VAGVVISSPDKVLWPASEGRPPITKADLARYFEAAAERLLPHVADRPVSIIRAPDGIEGETFFQRHAMAGSNPRLKLIDVKARTPYVAVVDVGGLAAVAQSGGLELHPWGCKPGDPETPDQITFDLDPDVGLDFDDVIAASGVVKARLEALGLTPFVKTTGGKGLHVVAPIRADGRSRVTWEQNKAFAKAVSEAIKVEAPDRFTTTLAKKARGGKIFIDYLRNGRMATAVAPWSPRARPAAGIAFPLSWDQVKPGLRPADYNLWVWPELLERPDPWADFRAAAVSLRPALRKMSVE